MIIVCCFFQKLLTKLYDKRDDFSIDNIFVQRGGLVFQQTVSIPLETNCAPLFDDHFFILIISWSDQKEGTSFNFSFSLNLISVPLYRWLIINPSFGDLIHRIFPKEQEIKNTTDTVKSASYLDVHLEIDGLGKLLTKVCDKRDDFSFRSVNKIDMECSCHNSYVMPELAVTTQTFLYCARHLTVSF